MENLLNPCVPRHVPLEDELYGCIANCGPLGTGNNVFMCVLRVSYIPYLCYIVLPCFIPTSPWTSLLALDSMHASNFLQWKKKYLVHVKQCNSSDLLSIISTCITLLCSCIYLCLVITHYKVVLDCALTRFVECLYLANFVKVYIMENETKRPICKLSSSVVSSRRTISELTKDHELDQSTN